MSKLRDDIAKMLCEDFTPFNWDELPEDHRVGFYKQADIFLDRVKSELPEKHDVRPEITEWLVDKNRDEAEGFNKAIEFMEERLGGRR